MGRKEKEKERKMGISKKRRNEQSKKKKKKFKKKHLTRSTFGTVNFTDDLFVVFDLR